MNELMKKKAEQARPPLRLMDPVVGYGAHNRQVSVGNIHEKDWQICRSQAQERVKKNYAKLSDKKETTIPKNNFMADIVSVTSESNFMSDRRPYKSFRPVAGYQGFIKRVAADNIMGCTYQTAIADSKTSVDKLKYYNSLNFDGDNVKSFPNLKRRVSTKAAWK